MKRIICLALNILVALPVFGMEPEFKCRKLAENNVISVNFNRAGTIAITASGDGTAKIWDVESGKCLATLRHENNVRSAKFNRAGTLAITASDEGTVKIWDIRGNCLAKLKHNGWVRSAKFNRAGTLAITASKDGTTNIWDINGNCLATLLYADEVRSAKFNRAGDRIFVCTAGGLIYSYDLPAAYIEEKRRAREAAIQFLLSGHNRCGAGSIWQDLDQPLSVEIAKLIVGLRPTIADYLFSLK